MKKNLIYGLMSAIALTGAMGFTACSSDDAATDVNPTYDGNSVKTQFSISFPDNVSTGGRPCFFSWYDKYCADPLLICN